MADWMTLATIYTLVGLEIGTIGMINSGGNDAAQACIIIGIICYIVTSILVVLMKTGSLGGDKAAKISACVIIGAAGLLILVGAAIWGDNSAFGGQIPYRFTCDIIASALAFLAMIFFVMDLVGGGGSGSKTGPS